METSLTGMVQKWVADSELPARIMMMKIGSVNIGCPNAPTESRYNATDEAKFCTQLSTMYIRFTKRLPTLILDDFNARVSANEIGHSCLGTSSPKAYIKQM